MNRGLVLCVLAGCQAGGVIEPVMFGASSTTTATNPTSGTVTTGTTPTTTTTPVTICMTPPPVPTSYDTLFGIPTSEEFTLSVDGELLNVNDSVDLFYRSTIMGETVVVAPYSSQEVAAVRLMIDGDLVIADEGNGALIRMTLGGSSQVLLGNIPGPNSMAIHPDGWIFTTSQEEMWRVDPDGLLPAEVMFGLPGHDLDGVTFSPDFDWLYFNSDEQGLVFKSRVTNDLRLEEPIEIANLAEGWEELDGMAVDVCGWLYVTFTDGRIQRVDPVTGQVQDFIDIPGGWTTAIHFGNGVGGWQTDHAYVMDRSGGVYDIAVGIDGKWEPHHPAP